MPDFRFYDLLTPCQFHALRHQNLVSMIFPWKSPGNHTHNLWQAICSDEGYQGAECYFIISFMLHACESWCFIRMKHHASYSRRILLRPMFSNIRIQFRGKSPVNPQWNHTHNLWQDINGDGGCQGSEDSSSEGRASCMGIILLLSVFSATRIQVRGDSFWEAPMTQWNHTHNL